MASSETPTTQSQEASSAQSLVQKNVRGKTDIGWAHCKIVGPHSNMCIYCEKVINGGGINRVKQHLAGIVGHVEACKKVSPEIRFQMNQNIDECRSKKRKTLPESDLSTQAIDEVQAGHEQTRPTVVASQRGNKVGRVETYFLPRTTHGAQPTIKSALQSKEVIENCDLALAKWFIDASIPFNAVNSPYFQPAIDALCCMGAGYKGPNMHALRGPLLNKWVDDTKILVEKYRLVWEKTGCTLMADGWTDQNKRTLINFIVYCPKGTVFLKSVDASHASKTADTLYKLFREVVLHVGPDNIVQIVTDNAANYVAAGRLLEKEFPKLYWSPCVAHCINLMLQLARHGEIKGSK